VGGAVGLAWKDHPSLESSRDQTVLLRRGIDIRPLLHSLEPWLSENSKDKAPARPAFLQLRKAILGIHLQLEGMRIKLKIRLDGDAKRILNLEPSALIREAAQPAAAAKNHGNGPPVNSRGSA
jgi:hypothetical protein